MNWEVAFSRAARKFIETEHIAEERLLEIATKAVRKIEGKWAGFHRIRIGRLRVIAEFNFDAKRVYIERVDWRGNVYH